MKPGKKFTKPNLSRVINGDIAPKTEAENAPVPKKIRLDAAIAERFAAINRSQAAKLVVDGKVQVNGVQASKASLQVADSDYIEADLPQKATKTPVELPVLYEDDDVVVINKPAGVLSHTKGDSCSEFTVADFLRPLNQDQAENNRTGIVHRLDRDTSGVMIGAKNEKARAKLQAQFSQRKVNKTYYAVIDGHLKNDQALINLPIRRNAKRPTTFLVKAGGREAVTAYQVKEMNNRYSLVELKPQTGRTHQLRVHLAHLGHPILGDRVYGTEADRLYLHAAELEITLPNGERKVFKSPVPPEFKVKVQ
ncbi:MAG: RluA family pseudouridine synthase [Candidatus Nomurabacteria bacterium]|jgi:23S rRNA pseudouridine1911/1915/1917 synthase|nr:RluA family pseudouridine synthase [Candidatus Nomurabacteria bacterium]